MYAEMGAEMYAACEALSPSARMQGETAVNVQGT